MQKENTTNKGGNFDQPNVTCKFKVGDIVRVDWNEFVWKISKLFEHKNKMRALLEHDHQKQIPIYRAGWNNKVWDEKCYIDGYFPLIAKSSSWVDALRPL